VTKPVETSKPRKAKQEFVYFIDTRWTSFGAGIDCVNSKEIFTGVNKTFMAIPLDMRPDGFNPMTGLPLMQFKGKADKFHYDFEVVGGIWVLSPPVREFFEKLDAGAFAFRECKTQYPDGNYGATARNYFNSVRMIEPWPAAPCDHGAVHSTKVPAHLLKEAGAKAPRVREGHQVP
jgi:Protein of unknown function (DUF1629)